MKPIIKISMTIMMASLLIMAIDACMTLCACGTNAAQSQSATPDVAVDAKTVQDDSPDANDSQCDDRISLNDISRSFVGGPIENLIEELGEPESRTYGPSCLGAGEDGELHYARFTVYTFKSADGGETIVDVE